jgi:hypothetical protein
MATTITPAVQNIMGNMLTELLNGQLSDATINAVDGIQRQDVPEPLRDVVGYMHGMSTMPQLRHSIVKDLLRELAAGSKMLADEMAENVPPGSF